MDSSAFTVDVLSAEDYDDIVALWQRAGLHVRPEGRDSPAAFSEQMRAGRQRVIGAHVGATLVAVAVLTDDGRKGWVNRLAVDPGYWRQGLATALLTEAERWFGAELGLEVWAALIEKGNLPSQALFAELGYERLDLVYVSKRTRPEA
jgi:N-acetylglutamate synthase